MVEGDVGEPRNGALAETGEEPVNRPGTAAFRCRPAVWRPGRARRARRPARFAPKVAGRTTSDNPQRRCETGEQARPATVGRQHIGPQCQRGPRAPEPSDAHGDREERSSAAHRAGGGRQRRTELAGEGRRGADEHELTLDELLEEAGVEIETVRELEGFGLITPKVIGGSHYYTPDAAVVARLASAFARHGVEARHFRAYKGAADREAGLVEQVIMPLIRQRNPEARLAAAQAVEELSNLGGELRAALLRSALADLH